METSDTTNPKNAPPPVDACPHAKRPGHLLFLSGMGPRPAGSRSIPDMVTDDTDFDRIEMHSPGQIEVSVYQ